MQWVVHSSLLHNDFVISLDLTSQDDINSLHFSRSTAEVVTDLGTKPLLSGALPKKEDFVYDRLVPGGNPVLFIGLLGTAVVIGQKIVASAQL